METAAASDAGSAVDLHPVDVHRDGGGGGAVAAGRPLVADDVVLQGQAHPAAVGGLGAPIVPELPAVQPEGQPSGQPVDGDRVPLGEVGPELPLVLLLAGVDEHAAALPPRIDDLGEVDLGVLAPLLVGHQQRHRGVAGALLGPEPDLPAAVGLPLTGGDPAGEVTAAVVAGPQPQRAVGDAGGPAGARVLAAGGVV